VLFSKETEKNIKLMPPSPIGEPERLYKKIEHLSKLNYWSKE
jgi:hypothetical protein